MYFIINFDKICRVLFIKVRKNLLNMYVETKDLFLCEATNLIMTIKINNYIYYVMIMIINVYFLYILL